MSIFHNALRRMLPLAIVGWLVACAEAEAGWFGIQNETKQTIIVQETLAQGRQGKPFKIPSEDRLRDTQGPNAGTRTFTVYNADKPAVALITVNFPCPAANENVLYILKTDKEGKITIEAVKTPATPPKTGSTTPPPKTGTTPPPKKG
jgi:hypothetical protein